MDKWLNDTPTNHLGSFSSVHSRFIFSFVNILWIHIFHFPSSLFFPISLIINMPLIYHVSCTRTDLIQIMLQSELLGLCLNNCWSEEKYFHSIKITQVITLQGRVPRCSILEKTLVYIQYFYNILEENPQFKILHYKRSNNYSCLRDDTIDTSLSEHTR